MPAGFTAELSRYTSRVNYASVAGSPQVLLAAPCPSGTVGKVICNYEGECGVVCVPTLVTPTPTPCDFYDPGWAMCGKDCVNLDSDAHNCGSCGNVCPMGPLEQLSCCYGGCTDLTSDPNHCGGCGTVCPQPSNGYGSATCTPFSTSWGFVTGGTCGIACKPGYTPSGTCCCPPGTTCTDGICCPQGQSNCNGQCTDLTTDSNNCGFCGNVCVNSQTCQKGQCSCLDGMASCGSCCCIPTNPSSGQNFGINSSCQNITGLSVQLTVTQTLVSSNGFSIQLNGHGPNNAGGAISATECVGGAVWQQYLFVIDNNQIYPNIQLWPSTGPAVPPCMASPPCNCAQILYFTGNQIGNSLTSNMIPAGYIFNISLGNDSSGNVNSVTFQVTDNTGKTSSQTVQLDSLPWASGYNQAIAPITAFDLEIVGTPGYNDAQFSTAGGGTITYTANAPLTCAGGILPQCTGWPPGTGESSNASYGILNACPAQSMTQQFSIIPTPSICATTNGPCTGAGGSDQCITINGVTQCCHSNWFWGWYPWMTTCSDGTVENQGCGGPCY
jgi:hypothetical protein